MRVGGEKSVARHLMVSRIDRPSVCHKWGSAPRVGQICSRAMRTKRHYWIAVLILLSACAPAGDSSGRFTAVADVQQLMASIVDPAADFYWDAVGWIIDENGTEEIRPANDEEWEAVVNAAFLIAESGNLHGIAFKWPLTCDRLIHHDAE